MAARCLLSPSSGGVEPFMKQASLAGVCALCLGITLARGGDRRDERSPEQQTAEGRPRPVEVTGCLTARGDQFVVTDLQREGQASATESYQLIGNEEELRQHIGKQVRVVGEADPQQVAEVRESTPPSGATGTAGQQPQTGQPAKPPQPGEPQVKTETETRMEVAKLRVQSVTPSGETCAAETTGGTPPQPRRQ